MPNEQGRIHLKPVLLVGLHLVIGAILLWIFLRPSLGTVVQPPTVSPIPATLTPTPLPWGKLTDSELFIVAEYEPIGSDLLFEWAPDSRHVVVKINDTLCLMDIDHYMYCIPSVVLPGPIGVSTYREPHWSANGKHVSFLTFLSIGSHCATAYLNTIETDDDKPHLMGVGDEMSLEAHWSPDGERLAFVGVRSCLEKTLRSERVGILDMATGETSYVTEWEASTAYQMLGYSPWSPDGSHLAFVGSDGLYTIGTDGTNKTRLMDAVVGLVGWTWNGGGVIYSDVGGVSVVEQEGTIRRLSEGYPVSLSPDRRKLLVRDQDALLIVDVDTGQRVAIGGPDGYRIFRICSVQGWSPDGKRLALTSYSGGPASSVVVVNVDGTGLMSLISGGCPQWSPDGKYLGYIDP
jgi:hypothetical protein